MARKANISMNATLYSWLEQVSARMGARSVPGVARAILMAVMRASTSNDAAFSMLMMIQNMQPEDHSGEDTDMVTDDISRLMADYEEADRLNPTQRINLNRRT